MKEKMRLGQRCLFYASNCKVPGITAVAKVSSEGYPDHNAWDPKHPSVFRSTFMGGF
jgi:predicted RNA-binding protein with PUA-like domain